jgi:hypothetical protein
VVLNNDTYCCFKVGPTPSEAKAESPDIRFNPSLPNMPPALVGKLDEATWKAVLKGLNSVGSHSEDKVLHFVTCLTCTVRPDRSAAVLAAALTRRFACPTQWCFILPCALRYATNAQDKKITAFVAEFEKNEALKKAGVSVKQGKAQYVYPDFGEGRTYTYIRFDVAQGAPTTEPPAAQAMA